MKKIKYYINKYGVLKCISLVIRKLLSYVITFLRKVCNSFIEITSNNYFIVRSAIARPLYKNNWGDYVSIILAEQLAPNSNFIGYRESWNVKRKKNYLCIGSIITWMTTPSSIIWGSGVVYPDKKLQAKPSHVLAVRGPLTRQYLLDNGVECPEIYGDPALLLPSFYKPTRCIKYKLGIIPHFRDKNNPVVQSLMAKDAVLFIDVQDVQDWRSFIDKINMCEFVISSSLHGIITADAYNVPNAWVEFEGGEQKRFAFHDYLLSVSKKIQDPFEVNETTTTEDLLPLMQNWTYPQIDLSKLLAVCPFKN